MASSTLPISFAAFAGATGASATLAAGAMGGWPGGSVCRAGAAADLVWSLVLAPHATSAAAIRQERNRFTLVSSQWWLSHPERVTANRTHHIAMCRTSHSEA